MAKRSRKLWHLLTRREEGGLAALEFGLITPTFFMVLAGTVDFGDIMLARFKLDAGIAAASNYILVNRAEVSTGNATGPAGLASAVASIIVAANTSSHISGKVTVNNGAVVTITNGSQVASGTASADSNFYCPTGTPTSVTWGSAVAQNASCTGGGTAGWFVNVTASYSFTPIITGFGFTNNGTITAGTMVQVSQ